MSGVDVDELRYAAAIAGRPARIVILAAADEIVRLRAEVERLYKMRHRHGFGGDA